MADGIYYASVAVDGTANAETLESILTSTEEEKKTILMLWFVEVTTAAEENDAQIAAYIEREQIVDAPIEMFLNQDGAAASQLRNRVLNLNHVLPVGQTLKVGHTSGATASDIEYMVAYQIE